MYTEDDSLVEDRIFPVFRDFAVSSVFDPFGISPAAAWEQSEPADFCNHRCLYFPAWLL